MCVRACVRACACVRARARVCVCVYVCVCVTDQQFTFSLFQIYHPLGQPVVVKVDPQSFLPSVTPMVTLECSMTAGSAVSPTVLFMQLKKSALSDR